MIEKLEELPNFRHHKTAKNIISLKKGFRSNWTTWLSTTVVHNNLEEYPWFHWVKDN
jgi:hypothetical protein